MSDITRDDLRKMIDPGDIWTEPDYDEVSDEEFDRLAGERTAELLDDPSVRSDLLRALLTDECDCMGAPWCNRHDSQYINDGYCDRVLDEEGVTPENMEERACQEEDHYVCGGRGWLPKDGVSIHRNASTGYETAMFPADWLEAEDEKLANG